ncbi:anosmin-1a isoform X2 [Entelurus aequoreus]|uniref:anosmin-1a isoform X2 n=1 Tax=Entelurus aequoreus TaxID=161455 RepID=UPI002B1DC785|nr:anosmin-1a isoform X2 [Entelurus aequoreus]
MWIAVMHMQQWIIPLLFIFLCDVCSKKLLRCIKDDDDDGKDGESWLESFPRARCKSRCLSLHSAATLQNNGSLSWCHSQKECAKCLEPCKNSGFMKKKKNCRELCERLFPKKHWECLASCQFLVSVMELKQGDCPPPDWATGFAAACVESCDYDTECPAQKKCCSNSCGHTCQTPKDLYKDPSRPPAPTELRVTNMMFTASSAVQVQLQWCMRGDLDVPVHYYKVSWTWTGQIPASSMTKRKKIVRESQVVLDSMQSNHSYSVEVQAVCYWKQTQLKGPRAIAHFHTLHDKSRDLPGDILDVGTPFYQNGQLQVHIYWKSSTDPSVEYYRIQWVPEYCEHNQTAQRKKTNTQGTFFNMQDLLFSCKYKVLLQPISRTSHQPAKSISFITPSCVAIQAKSSKLIACHGVTPQKVLVKLTNLTVSFKFHGSNMTTIFNWGVSSHRYLTGYQVTLVEVTSSSRLDNKKLHRRFTSQAQILPEDVSSLVVSGLHATSVYRLEVRAIVADGEGHAISRIFQTPGLHKVEKHRKYD